MHTCDVWYLIYSALVGNTFGVERASRELFYGIIVRSHKKGGSSALEIQSLSDSKQKGLY